jgi:simple sugar transport system substrate-binding protein
MRRPSFASWLGREVTIMRLSLALLVFAVAGCAAPAATPPKPLRLLFLTPFAEYGFFAPVKKGVADAAQALGVEATFTGTPDGNVQVLAGQIRQAVQAGYDGIAVNLIDPVAFDTAVAEAIRQGVPVIAFNVDDSRTPNARLAAIGQHMLEAGRSFGRAVDGFIPPGSHVLLTMHDPNITALEERAAGAREVLQAKRLTWTTVITSTNPDTAVERIRAALAADPRLTVVLGTGSADTEAAGRAIEKYFPNQGYVAAGFDLSPEILRLVKAKVLRLTVDQQPYAQGYYAVVVLTLLRRYGLAPASINTGAAIITAESAEQVLALSKQQYR